MMTPRQSQVEKEKRIRGRNGRTRFPGICSAAVELGVSRQHLYFVLTGERRSPRIEAWVKQNLKNETR